VQVKLSTALPSQKETAFLNVNAEAR